MTKEETKSPEREQREKPSRNRSQRKEKLRPLTKVIMRHLPPTMTEEEFLKQTDPLPDHDFYYYATADWSLGFDATCRAYINFRRYDDVFLFRDRFDGYVFVDSKGAEYAANVEFAPFQGLAKNKSRKTDTKTNSIESEPHYTNFLQKLEEDREAAAKGGESKLEFSLLPKDDKKITSTPLLQYLASKKEKRREETKRRMEEKRRQRDEEKERQRQRQIQQVPKIIASQSEGSVGKKDFGKSQPAKGGESADKPLDERKNARAKRRAERDQKRREEYEQRRRERERAEKERKAVGECGGDAPLNADTSKPELVAVSTSLNQEDSKRKEVKKYSERRERDRNRAKNIPQQLTGSASCASAISATVANPSNTPEQEISDSVKQFIQSVASVKEVVPIQKQVQEENDAAKMSEIGEKLQSISLSTTEEKEQHDETAKQPKLPHGSERSKRNSESNTDLQKQQQRAAAAEEKRIRNKDRPSIAIYQPKPRNRDGGAGTPDAAAAGSKDVRSNPTSDCEKEERPQTRKISRYSERRSRRAREKFKERRSSGGGDADGNGDYGENGNDRLRDVGDRKESTGSCSKSGEESVEPNPRRASESAENQELLAAVD